MDDRERQRQMSLVPYVPAESREIVLRHGSAVVVYDQHSRQLSLRDASRSTAVEPSSCPYCHRPYRENSHHDTDESDDHDHSPPPLHDGDTGFVNPGYFQMLRRSQPGSTEVSRPSSPHKQLAPPPIGHTDGELHAPPGAEFVGSTPALPKHQGISARAFSPNYFKTFFVEERELGRGGKGVVLLVRHMLDDVNLGLFACKRVPVGDDHEWLEKVLIEVQLLQNLSHQNLVSYRHVWLEDYQISNFGPSVPCAFILQQYCNGGDLQSYILGGAKRTLTTEQMKARLRRRSKGQLDEPQDLNGPRHMHFEEIISFFKDITSGLNHLHANGYIHRDLKPSNCLLHNTGKKLKVLVSDFGEVQAANVARKSTGATGTISYCAPEVLRHVTPAGPLGNFTTKSDIFSLGMIVYFMCFSRLPYREADGIDEDNEDLDKLRDEISRWAGFDDERRVRSDLPEKLYGSLKHLLALDPNERPTTEEILQALKSTSVLDEFSGFAGPSGLKDAHPRISRADTPSPGPAQTHRKRSSVNYTRPGRSNLGASVTGHSSPSTSPSRSPNNSPPDASVVLRPRPLDKVDFPPPHQHPHRSPSPGRSPRLMLPPPPPPAAHTHFYYLLHNPTFIGVTKISIFVAKVFSLFSPCQPLAADPWAAYPLLCFASLDFLFVGFGFTLRGRHLGFGGLGGSLLLLVMHVMIVGMLLRLDRLCLTRGVSWEGL
ncbi:kinase-like protein [Lentithecium fluviatile CBS 122367]|uniref:non-specific serine/threonine protein kinase n=1 Tax=Lentithecium fluviatile CBS 122367 TaxID=1168545 RepID=A0A6G1JGZ8_9PLEO|nr:kinase-like protein [Lentithecium fluviatile CBS 122367]